MPARRAGDGVRPRRSCDAARPEGAADCMTAPCSGDRHSRGRALGLSRARAGAAEIQRTSRFAFDSHSTRPGASQWHIPGGSPCDPCRALSCTCQRQITAGGACDQHRALPCAGEAECPRCCAPDRDGPGCGPADWQIASRGPGDGDIPDRARRGTRQRQIARSTGLDRDGTRCCPGQIKDASTLPRNAHGTRSSPGECHRARGSSRNGHTAICGPGQGQSTRASPSHHHSARCSAGEAHGA